MDTLNLVHAMNLAQFGLILILHGTWCVPDPARLVPAVHRADT